MQLPHSAPLNNTPPSSVIGIKNLHTHLSLNSLRILVQLGCSAKERETPQYVRFDVSLRFAQPPSGCVTDLLEETICYAKLSDEIQKVCNKREYQLIEKLTWDTYISIKATLPKDIQLWLRATKERPPIAHLEGGSSFSIGDWNPS